MLAKGTIQNLIGGVSQQAVALRLSTQSQDETNTFPVIVDGNVRRPPSEHVFAYPTAIPVGAFTHPIIRDADEKYVVVISNGAITVTDLAGNPKTVHTPDGVDYLGLPAGTDAKNLAAVTVADYTFIVNKTKVVAMTSEIAPVQPPTALFNVIQGNYGKTYSTKITPHAGLPTGPVASSYTTPPGGAATDAYLIDTNSIALHVASTLVTDGFNAANGWDVGVVTGNWFTLRSYTGVDFDIDISDGYGGHAMKVIKGRAQNFTDLPPYGPDGFVAAIVGDMSNPNSLYYVKFTKDTSGSHLGVAGPSSALSGNWEECPAPGTKIALDPDTMPHVLVREADGSFTFKKAVWDKRVAGDADVIPPPSFVGKTITDTAFYDNRLGFFTDGNVVWSRAGDFFNFWRTSAITLLDDDPIDINATSKKVAILRAATPYQQSLILWSDVEQFTFQGNELLTPKTANMHVSSGYENISKDVKPVETTRRIFFATDRNQWTGIREWYYDIYYHIASADEATAHVPVLIPTGANKMSNSTVEDILAVSTSGAPQYLFIYKYFWQGNDKVQQSWTKWFFGEDTQVINHFFDASTLYVLLRRGSQTVLEKLRCNPGLTDNGDPVIYLDRRIGSERLPSPAYSPSDDTTLYALPYDVDASTIKAVTRKNSAGPQFIDVEVVGAGGNVVSLRGDTTALSLYFGQTFKTEYVFSPIFARDPNKDAIQEGKLKLLKLHLTYQKSGYFRIMVTPTGRRTSSYELNGWSIGDDLPDVDSVIPLRNGVYTVPILADASTVDIRIVNDSFLPSRFIRAEWKGNFVPKARK